MSWLLIYAYGSTDWFAVEHGVSQGCIPSPHLFNIYSEQVMRNALEGFTVGGKEMTNLRYADDVVWLRERVNRSW